MSAVRPVSFAAGGVAAMYCGYYLYVWLFRPIKRDQILVRGKFLRKVICFVLLVPFLLAAVFYMSGLQSSVLMSEAPASADAAGFGEGESLLWCIYCHFVDPGNQHMASAAGRGWTVLISISGILLLNGLLGWCGRWTAYLPSNGRTFTGKSWPVVFSKCQRPHF